MPHCGFSGMVAKSCLVARQELNIHIAMYDCISNHPELLHRDSYVTDH